MNAPRAATPPTDLLVLKVLPTAVHCREIGAGPVTLRRKLDELVPGHRLTVAVTKKWQWRKTEMLGGDLLHVDFSLRALQQAGFGRTRLADGRLASPGDSDARLREGLLENDAGNWMVARALLLSVLEDEPGNLLAHAALATIHERLARATLAQAHATVGIRLGLGALVHEESVPIDPVGETERALLRSLVLRARLLADGGRPDAAAADLRRALAWDPTDAVGAGPKLAALTAEGRGPTGPGAGEAR